MLEARAAGADLVLLIVAALDDDTLRRLHDQAGELGLTVLVEVHDEAETDRAVDLGAELVGVNARNLKTLEVDPDTFGRLAPLVPDDRVLVAESGIASPVDVKRYVAEGARAVLVGEALVKDGDPEGAVRAMTGIDGMTGTAVRRRRARLVRRLRRPVHARGPGRRARRAHRGLAGGDGRPGVRGRLRHDPARVRRRPEPALRRRPG